MKFVHTFWSKPFLNNKFNDKNTLLEVILSDYAYSVACIKHFGHTIRLFTDSYGKKLLGYIPYDDIVVMNDLDDENINFAAQIKFKALEQMSIDEYLIDGDLFLRGPLVYSHINSMNSDCIYSFFEPEEFTKRSKSHTKYFIDLKEIVAKHNDEFEDIYKIQENVTFDWTNTSFLKFNNEELKRIYVAQYWKNKKLVEKEQYGEIWPDIWLEQKNLTLLLKNSDYTNSPVIYGYPSGAAEMYAQLLGFVHLGADKVGCKDLIFEWLKNLDLGLCQKTIQQIEKYK